MNNILEMIKNEKVEWKKLWEVTSWDKKFNGVEKSKQQKVDKYHYYLASELKALSSNDGNIKILTTNITDMYANEDDVSNNISSGEIVCIPWGGNPVVQYFNGKFITGDNRIARSTDTNILLNKYLYYFLLENIYLIEKLYRGSGIKHPNMKRVLEIEIPIPSLETQERIVKILDTMVDHFTQLQAELQAELQARNRQYEHYRDKLLSEEYLNKLVDKYNFDCIDYELKEFTLGQVIKLKNGKDWKKLNKGTIPVYGSGGPMEVYVNKFSYNKETVLIPRKGSIDNVFYLDKPFWNVDTIYYTEVDTKVLNIKYFYYFMTNIDLSSLSVNPTRPSLTQGIINNIRIIIPPISVQEHIVSILDNFNKIVSDINEGLPKEIELRQKQYEYYRERLLDFKREED